MTKSILGFILLLLLFLTDLIQIDSQTLFRIKENGLWGYIDIHGNIVIPLKFKNAGEFSEGLAPVREKGYFGFIDTNGHYALQPVYDYAEPFKNGFAKIFNNGIPNFINKSGDKIIPFECSDIFPFENGRAIVYTKMYSNNRKAGVIDETGNLILDTIYSIISDCKNGLFVVQQPYKKYGVVDSIGNVIVPYGKFYSIKDFHNGFAKVNWYINDDKNSVLNLSQGFINKEGHLVFSIEHSFYIELNEMVSSDSLFISSEYDHGINDNGSGWTAERIRGGLMNLNGDWICTDSSNYRFTNIGDKICTIDSNKRYVFVDRDGKMKGSRFFNYENDEKVIYSVAGVHNNFGIIDTSLNYVVKPFYDLNYFKGICKDYFIYGKYMTDNKGKYISDHNGNHISKWGICNINGNIIHKPAFENVDYNGYVNGLILVLENGNLAYVDKQGNEIWNQKSLEKDVPLKLDIDYQLRTWYTYNHFGWTPVISGAINNKIEKIKFAEDSLSMFLVNNEKVLFQNKYEGISLYLINDCEHSISAPSVDGALYLVLQAKDKDGNWKSIESYPTSMCGNSYVPTSIYSKYYRKYSVPYYCGEYKTKIKASLRIYDENGKNIINIYSNEIDGSINPAQFWRAIPFLYSQSLLDR